MADARVNVSIIVHTVEVLDVQPGAWCPYCLLPSASVITLASVRGDGPLQLSTGVRCHDCHRWSQTA